MGTQIAVGSAKVTAVLDAEGPFFLPLPEVFPSLDEETRLAAERIDPPGANSAPDVWWLAFRVYVVEVGDRVLLVDTGSASDTDLRPFWAPVGPHLTQRLVDELGLAPDAVTDVVLTHLHRDHAAGSIDTHGAPAFPNAAYHLQARELETVTSGESSELWSPLLTPLTAAGQLQTWDGLGELGSFDDTRLRLEASPGHTPGHQSMLIRAADEVLVLAGDVFTHAAQLVDPSTEYALDDDTPQAGRTRNRLLERFREVPARLGTAHLGVPFVDLPSDIDPATRKERPT